MNLDAAKREISTVDWNKVRALLGSAQGVSDSFEALVEAQTNDEAEDAYWRLDNFVVVQGRLYEAALYLVEPLIMACSADISRAARRFAIDLLVELATGTPAVSEVAQGNVNLGEDVRSRIKAHMSKMYAHLTDHDPYVRLDALHIIDRTDENRRRVYFTAASLVASDPDEDVRRLALEIQQESPEVT